jgi:hypothetical protein
MFIRPQIREDFPPFAWWRLTVSGLGYQLQFGPSLDSPLWTNSGIAQPGTGNVLTFADPGGATNKPTRFYQVDVIWP